jgi:hypothetical protein
MLMDASWIPGIITGIIATVICGSVALVWRVFWNPVRWTLEQLAEGVWSLTRSSGPTAFAVTTVNTFAVPPAWTDEQYIAPGEVQRHVRDAYRGDVYDLQYQRENFGLTWVERGRRLIVQFGVREHEVKIEVRRRSVVRIKRTDKHDGSLYAPWEAVPR